MKNYEEKEKKLENVLKKLNTMSNRVIKMSNDINSLNLEKNQLLREKEESYKNFQNLSEQNKELKSKLNKGNHENIIIYFILPIPITFINIRYESQSKLVLELFSLSFLFMFCT